MNEALYKVIIFRGHFGAFNDPVLGNCYTFNYENSTKAFKAVQAGEKGGLIKRFLYTIDEY